MFEPRIATLGGLETGDFAEHLRSTGLGVKRNSHNLASLKSFDVAFKKKVPKSESFTQWSPLVLGKNEETFFTDKLMATRIKLLTR